MPSCQDHQVWQFTGRRRLKSTACYYPQARYEVTVLAPRARLSCEPGATPQGYKAHELALKARLIQKPPSAIVPLCLSRLARSSFTNIQYQRPPPMAGRQRPAKNARLSRHHLPGRGRGSLPRRRCGRSCSPNNDAAANSLPGGHARGLKKKSSKWIKGLAPDYRHFYWQRGYGAFSVSPSQLGALLEYVETQEQHHRIRTFQEEYREFLRKHGVEYDERYVWD